MTLPFAASGSTAAVSSLRVYAVSVRLIQDMAPHNVSESAGRVHDQLFGHILPFWTGPALDHEQGGWLAWMSNDLRVDRSQFIAEMRRRGVSCSVHFKPIPLHSYYRNRLELRDPCSRAISEYPRLVSLPLSSRLNDAEVARVVDAVRDICG
jgi:hypothetical protein